MFLTNISWTHIQLIFIHFEILQRKMTTITDGETMLIDFDITPPPLTDISGNCVTFEKLPTLEDFFKEICNCMEYSWLNKI